MLKENPLNFLSVFSDAAVEALAAASAFRPLRLCWPTLEAVAPIDSALPPIRASLLASSAKPPLQAQAQASLAVFYRSLAHLPSVNGRRYSAKARARKRVPASRLFTCLLQFLYTFLRNAACPSVTRLAVWFLLFFTPASIRGGVCQKRSHPLNYGCSNLYG